MPDDRERELRILKVARYKLQTDASTRKIADVFGVSNCTIHDYLESQLPLLAKRDGIPEVVALNEQVQALLQKSRKSTLHQMTMEKVRFAYQGLLDGKYLSDIAQELDEDYLNLYRSLKNWLPKLPGIGAAEIEQINQILQDHKIGNLTLGSAMPVPSERRNFLGQFDVKGKTK